MERIYPVDIHDEIEEYAQARGRKLTDDEILALGFGLGQGMRVKNTLVRQVDRVLAILKQELTTQGALYNETEVDCQLADLEIVVKRALELAATDAA